MNVGVTPGSFLDLSFLKMNVWNHSMITFGFIFDEIERGGPLHDHFWIYLC